MTEKYFKGDRDVYIDSVTSADGDFYTSAKNGKPTHIKRNGKWEPITPEKGETK